MSYQALRKPLLIGATTGLVFFLLHLIGVYIYDGSKAVGEVGGMIRVGIIGEPTKIPNPLNYGQDKHEDLILKFLFKGLTSYNPQSASYQGNLANCDLANLAKIRCNLQDNIFWSDGSEIKIDDIFATYKSIKETSSNPKIRAFLGDVQITGTGKEIVLSAKEKNSLILDLLEYPIIRSDMIENIRTNRLKADGYITSGPYVFKGIEKNEQFGYTKVEIERSPKNGGESSIMKFDFLFFPSLTSLEKNTDSLNVIIPPVTKETIKADARFTVHTYSMYEFIGAFLNTDTIKKELRRTIAFHIGNTLSPETTDGYQPIGNIFLTSSASLIPTEKDNIPLLQNVMKDLGYLKREEIIRNIEAEPILLTGGVDYGENRYFQIPTRKKIFFSTYKDGGLVISGNVPSSVSNVSINGYTLKEYQQGNNTFIYRVSLDAGTIKSGKNEFTLSFGYPDGRTETQETLTVYYYSNDLSLNEAKAEVDKEYLAKLNTETLVNERQQAKIKKKQKAEALDPRLYYNKDYSPYTLRLAYVNEPAINHKYAQNIENKLLSIGIISSGTTLTKKDLQNVITSGKKNYDMIVVGIETSGKVSRLGQAFLSSEAGVGINFSKVTSKNLDSLFNSLRTATDQKESQDTIEKISAIMRDEGLIIPISTLEHKLYIDRNIRGMNEGIKFFRSIATLEEMIGNSYIKDKLVLDTKNKGFFHFFGWIFSRL